MNLLILLLALQDDAAKAKELLDAAAAAMKDASAVRFEFTIKWKGDFDATQKGKATLKRPNLARIETTWEDQEYATILDGTSYWLYMKATNQFTRMAQSKGMETNVGAGIAGHLFFGAVSEALADASGFAVKDDKIGEEKVQVVSWKSHQMSHRVWIDGKKLVRRHETKMESEEERFEQTTEYGAIDLAPKVEEDAFTVPKDATEYKEPELLAEGSVAPDFEGTDLDGKSVKLSDYKGKTVLINFWFYG